VLALPMEAAASAPPATPAQLSRNTPAGRRGGAGAGAPASALAAVAGWRTVLPEAQGADCLQFDHWRDDTFVLIIDDGDAPDGRVELVTVPLPGAAPVAPRGTPPHAAATARRRQALVGGLSGGSGLRQSSSVEVKEFAVTAGHAAVAVRRGGVCMIQVFDLEASVEAAPDAWEDKSGGESGSESNSESGTASGISSGSSSSSGGRKGSDSGSASGSGGGRGGHDNGRSSSGRPAAQLPQAVWEMGFGDGATTVVGLSSFKCRGGAAACGGNPAGFGGATAVNGTFPAGGGTRTWGNTQGAAGSAAGSGPEAVRLSEQSAVSPERVYALDLVTRSKTLVYEERMSGGFDSARYESRMEWAVSHDGIKVGRVWKCLGPWGVLCARCGRSLQRAGAPALRAGVA
jgi:hypothetical protein